MIKVVKKKKKKLHPLDIQSICPQSTLKNTLQRKSQHLKIAQIFGWQIYRNSGKSFNLLADLSMSPKKIVGYCILKCQNTKSTLESI